MEDFWLFAAKKSRTLHFNQKLFGPKELKIKENHLNNLPYLHICILKFGFLQKNKYICTVDIHYIINMDDRACCFLSILVHRGSKKTRRTFRIN